MARTTEQIESDLDEAKQWQIETTAALSGLTESIESLRSRAQEAGTSAKLDELTTQLSALKSELAEAKATQGQLQTELRAAEARLPSPPAPRAPRNGDADPADPPAPPDPPAQRRTRTGLAWL